MRNTLLSWQHMTEAAHVIRDAHGTSAHADDRLVSGHAPWGTPSRIIASAQLEQGLPVVPRRVMLKQRPPNNQQ